MIQISENQGCESKAAPDDAPRSSRRGTEDGWQEGVILFRAPILSNYVNS
jgi:hypothetical protein